MSERVKDWPNRLEIDSTVFLAPGAIVTGEVKIGARASVWFHTVVRGDTDRIEIGPDTNLQDLTMVHVDHGQPAIVGARVTVGHRAILHGCVIEDDVLIGMGAIVLSGARVGTGSLVAAGALVREGQTIPPGSLAVGTPARVLGPVQESHREAIAAGATHYAALASEYLARGFGQRIPLRDDLRGALGLPPAPMDHTEWERHLATLDDTPHAARALLIQHGADAFRRRPAEGRWCAHDVVAHLIDADDEVFAPRLERLLTEESPRLDAVDLVSRRVGAAAPAGPPEDLIESWSAARARLVERLAACGPAEWRRRGHHSLVGPYSITELTRAWVEHDLSHRRQMTEALEARP